MGCSTRGCCRKLKLHPRDAGVNRRYIFKLIAVEPTRGLGGFVEPARPYLGFIECAFGHAALPAIDDADARTAIAAVAAEARIHADATAAATTATCTAVAAVAAIGRSRDRRAATPAAIAALGGVGCATCAACRRCCTIGPNRAAAACNPRSGLAAFATCDNRRGCRVTTTCTACTATTQRRAALGTCYRRIGRSCAACAAIFCVVRGRHGNRAGNALPADTVRRAGRYSTSTC